MLKNRAFYFLAFIFIGLVTYSGFYLGFYNNQKSHQVEKPSVYESFLLEKVDNTSPSKLFAVVKDDKTVQSPNEQHAYLPEYLYNQTVLNKFIDGAKPYQIEEYFDKWTDKDDLDFARIDDKRMLAKSLVREFLGEQDNLNLHTDARINFSISHQINEENINSFELRNSRATLYAHFQLEGLIEPMDSIFVKWTHGSKVLLFNKKKINASTKSNWVSWTPDENWKVGIYTVVFYQFNKSLTPIIAADYYIY